MHLVFQCGIKSGATSNLERKKHTSFFNLIKYYFIIGIYILACARNVYFASTLYNSIKSNVIKHFLAINREFDLCARNSEKILSLSHIAQSNKRRTQTINIRMLHYLWSSRAVAYLSPVYPFACCLARCPPPTPTTPEMARGVSSATICNFPLGLLWSLSPRHFIHYTAGVCVPLPIARVNSTRHIYSSLSHKNIINRMIHELQHIYVRRFCLCVCSVCSSYYTRPPARLYVELHILPQLSSSLTAA